MIFSGFRKNGGGVCRFSQLFLVLCFFFNVSSANVFNDYLEIRDDKISEKTSKISTKKTFVVEPVFKRSKRAWAHQPFTIPYGYSGADIDFLGKY